MTIDISRKRFRPAHNYGGVLLQQGRVQLDSEWNEEVEIRDRRDRSEALDTFGHCAVPDSTPDAFRLTATGGTLEICPGRMYVDGLQAENHGAGAREWNAHLAEEIGSDPVAYEEQPYLPEAGTQAPLPQQPGTHLAYLDVWQRVVDPIIEPDLVESAVGVDTAARTQTVWQVKVLENVGDINCATPDDQIPGWEELTAPSAGRLSTSALAIPSSDDPCLLPPTGGYRGLENHAYRVEVHDGGTPLTAADLGNPPPAGTATFKWSRDNGTVATEVVALPSLDRVRVASLGRDEFLRFHDGDWVEVTDNVRELHGQPGFLSKVTIDEANQELLLEAPLPAGTFPTNADDTTDPSRRTRVRRWDQVGVVTDTGGANIVNLDAAGAAGSIPVPPAGTPIELEAGVVATFETPVDEELRSGDHWIFVARTADASVEELDQAPPCGIHHHYCKLATLHVDPDGDVDVVDCRHPWGCDCCCEISVAPGQDVQSAIDSVPALGGVVCLETGVHRLRRPLLIANRSNVTLRGCGPGSLLTAERDEAPFRALVHVASSYNIGIESLSISSSDSSHLIAVYQESAEVEVNDAVLITNPPAESASACVAVGDSREVTIRDCKLASAIGIGQVSQAALQAIEQEFADLHPQVEADPELELPVDDARIAIPRRSTTINGLFVENNSILSTRIGVLMDDVYGGAIEGNRMGPADEFFSQTPPEPPSIEAPEAEVPAPLEEIVVTARRRGHSGGHDADAEAFYASLPWQLATSEWDWSGQSRFPLPVALRGRLVQDVQIIDNRIAGEVGIELSYARAVQARRNTLHTLDGGIDVSMGFDLDISANKIEVGVKRPQRERTDGTTAMDFFDLADPTVRGAAIRFDFVRGVRIQNNTIKAQTGIVVQRGPREVSPIDAGDSLVRVLGIQKPFDVAVELGWLGYQLIEMLDPTAFQIEFPDKGSLEQHFQREFAEFVAASYLPSFVGKARINGNDLCVGGYGVLARRVFTLGGVDITDNRITGAQLSGIELKPLFGIGLVDCLGTWIGCLLEFVQRLLQLLYDALCRFLEGEELPDAEGEQGVTEIAITAISGLLSLCARLCGDDPDDGNGGDGQDEDPHRPAANDLKDALGRLLGGSCWLDDFLDGDYRVTSNTIRGSGNGIWVGIDGSRVQGNRVTIDADDPTGWEAVALGMRMREHGTGNDVAALATAQTLIDLDRDLLLFGLLQQDVPVAAPPNLGAILSDFQTDLSERSRLRPAAQRLANASAGDRNQEWRNLLSTIWASVRGYGIVLVGGNYCCEGNRVEAGEACFGGRSGGSLFESTAKPTAVGGVWHFSNFAAFAGEVARFALIDGRGANEELVHWLGAFVLMFALLTADDRELEISDNKIRDPLVHGISSRKVLGMVLADMNDNHIRNAGRTAIKFRGDELTMRAHRNALRRTDDVYGFLDRDGHESGFAQLIDIAPDFLGDPNQRAFGPDVLLSLNHGAGRRLDIGEGSAAVRVLARTAGISDNHVRTNANTAFLVQAVQGLFTDNLTNRSNVVTSSIEEPPNTVI